MIRFFCTFLISTLFCISYVSGGFAACENEGNITETSFKMDLGCLDPINE
jgi:hypothetical protein